MATNDEYRGTKVIIRRPNRVAAYTWSVFLSSTIGDLEDYRQEVQNDLLRYPEIVCFLSEDWISDYTPTVEMCRDKLKKAQGYIGIFGYWYGSIPPGYKKSITHLEFTWAVEQWSQEKPPPIAILMPKSPSKAERQLKQKAASLIASSKAKRKKHETLLKAFHDEVEQPQTWHLVMRFEDKEDLCKKVIVKCAQWLYGAPMDAAIGTVEVVELVTPARRVTPEEWGLLGRAEHLSNCEKILNQVALYPDVPAVAMLVHGNEDSGQGVFIRQLLIKKRLGKQVRFGRPPLEQYDVNVLMQWIGESLGIISKGKECTSLDELAELIHQELQRQQLGFILDHVYCLSGGVMTWYEKLWQPLYARLSELRKQNPRRNQHRLVAIVVDYQNQSAFDSDKSRQFEKTTTAEDYARLWILPVLRNITPGDLADWLEELDVPDDAIGRRARLTALAMKNMRGEIDGTPSRVFERLKTVSLWTGEES